MPRPVGRPRQIARPEDIGKRALKQLEVSAAGMSPDGHFTKLAEAFSGHWLKPDNFKEFLEIFRQHLNRGYLMMAWAEAREFIQELRELEDSVDGEGKSRLSRAESSGRRHAQQAFLKLHLDHLHAEHKFALQLMHDLITVAIDHGNEGTGDIVNYIQAEAVQIANQQQNKQYERLREAQG